MAKITTPVPGFTGRVAGVDFRDGTGETDNEGALAYFERQGYGIDGDPAEAPESLIEELPQAVVGVEIPTIDDGGQRDAADPRNELVPVGGVKSDGSVVAGPGKGKRIAPAPAPGQAVQETGDPKEQSATPAATNPADATTDAGSKGSKAGTADTGSESADTSKGA